MYLFPRDSGSGKLGLETRGDDIHIGHFSG